MISLTHEYIGVKGVNLLNRTLRKLIAFIVAIAMAITVSAPSADAAGVMSTASVKGIAAVSQSYNSVRVSWNKVKNASGYQVYYATSKNGKYTKKASVTGADRTSYLHSGAVAGKTYYYKVRAYGKRYGKTVYSKFSYIRSAYARPARINSISAEPAKAMEGYCSLDWTDIKGASGYQVQIRKKGDSYWQSYTYVNGDKYNIKINGSSAKVYLDNSEEYQVQVRSYRIVGKNRVYSSYSAVKTVTSVLPQVQEQVLYDGNDIRIVLKGIRYKDTFGSPELKLYIENNSAQDVTVQVRDMTINDLAFDPIMSSDVLSGKKVNDEITIPSWHLEENNIELIRDIDFRFDIFDQNTWDDIVVTDIIHVSTNAYDYEQAYDRSGQLVVDEQGIKIYLSENKGDNILEEPFRLFIENNSGRDITVQMRDTTINDYMMDPIMSCDIPSGKKAYDTITFFRSDFEENDIEIINKLETVFHIFGGGFGDTITDRKVIVNLYNIQAGYDGLCRR